MGTMSISAAKAKLNGLAGDAVRTHEHVTITKNGAPAAVMVSAEEWESLQETLFWQSQPGINQDVAAARVSTKQVKAPVVRRSAAGTGLVSDRGVSAV